MREAGSSEFKEHWRVLLGCALAASVGTIGLHGYTSGAFMPALTGSEGGFTRAQISLATLILSTTVAVVVPFCGAMMDRFGALRIISFAVFGEALAFMLLGLVSTSFPSYAGAIVLLALLGVGTTPPGFARIIAARFDRARGLALGIMISGLGLMAITGPIWATWLIDALGWRGAYIAMGGLVLFLGGSGLLLIRSDAARQPRSPEAQAVDQPTGSWATLRRPLYWLMLFGFILPALFGHGYVLHLITLLREQGFSASQAAQVQSLVGVAVLAGRLGSGWALDRFPAKRVAATAFTITGLGCALLLVDSAIAACLAALSIGLTVGAELDIMAYFISRYFGMVSFSRLYSLAYSGLIIGGGASPLLVATLASWSGGYTLPIIVSVVGTLTGALVFNLLPNTPGTTPVRVRDADR